MKPNINDRTKIQELKLALVDKNVSTKTIQSIEKALAAGMVFKKIQDFDILAIDPSDLVLLGDLVSFGGNQEPPRDVRTFEFTFLPVGEEKFFFGYQCILLFINKNKFTVEESFPIEDTRRVYIDIDFDDVFDKSKISFQVKSARGERSKIASGADSTITDGELIEVEKTDLANTVIKVEVDALAQVPNPPIKGSYQIKGKLISNQGESKLDAYQVVILAKVGNTQDGTPDFVPVAFAETETNGYFVTSFLIFTDPDDISHVIAAKAAITKGDVYREVPIKLVKTTENEGEDTVNKLMLPNRLILFINENSETADCKDCECNELNFHEKKVLEEFTYHTVVRTTEPSIIADTLEDEEEIDIGEIYGTGRPQLVPFSVFKKYQNTVGKQINLSNFNQSNSGTIVFSANIQRPAINTELLEKIQVETKIQKKINEKKRIFKGRTHLNALNRIDWDNEPTIYQAASVAHGHLLQFKQEWIPDGYSLGDLVYSLPLAPGQKKQIAVLDWERRESAANSQSLDFEESLNNSLVRDRDVNEVISATLNENIRASSSARTGGFGAGIGGAIMGVFSGGSFGGLLGISGGTSKSSSDAQQSSTRDSTANSFQSIRDRTTQAAHAVRSQRATVVQTVSQGERVQATSESVANYNHCHAITIQYFEVLRHFTIQHRIASVQECLFVPLQITPFDLEKCLRWRNTLENHLYRRDLLSAFNAVERIQNEKESPIEQYYDSIGFPRKNFAEQNINFYSGDLFMEFFFFNTKETKIDEEIILFYSFFGISLDAFRDKKITDEDLANHVGPRAIEFLLDAFTIETDKGVDLKLDLTLLSTFRQNANLRISVRQSGNTRVDIARNQINNLNIKLDLDKLPTEIKEDTTQFQNKFMKIRLRSGNLRYRTDNFSGTLFDGRIDNDIFPGGDGAFLNAPLTREELRNPRGEDVDSANNLIHHLNENLEYYHKCIWMSMTPERLFMLLDGIVAPGKANGRSVASVVENRVIGIAGNSLILPVAPGNQLDPTIDETFDLFAQYYKEDEDPIRVSMPTKGVYAEAIMGKCNSCEEKEESRFWRWEESPIPDSPTTPILPLNTDTRRADPGNLDPKDFPTPVVNIQNAPNVPDPTGLQGLLQLLGKGDAFRDLTGLNQNQLNALATFQKSLETAQSFGKEAAELAKAAGAMKLIEDAQQKGIVSNEDAKQKSSKVIDSAIPSTPEDQIARAKEQIGLVDTLQQQGGIASGVAEGARKQILDNLIKGTGSNDTSISDLGELMEKSSNLGADIKKDGDSFEISSNFGANSPLIIDVSVSPSLRAFGSVSGTGTNKTGKTKLSVKSKNAPSGSTLVWSIPSTETGKYTITQKMRGSISEVEITGIQPGITAIDVDLINGGTIIQTKYPQGLKLCIPQFVTIDEGGITSPLSFFDDFLTSFAIDHRKDDIVNIMKQVSDELLKTSNVRTIWRAGGFNETAPVHIPPANVTSLTINNTAAAAGAASGDIGVTLTVANAASLFNDKIFIFPAEITSLAFQDINVDVVALFNDVQSNGMTATLEPFVSEVLGRYLGVVIAHEIIHSLLGLDIPTGHNDPPIPGDLMNQGGDFSFTEATGFKNLASTSPVDPSHFTDSGVGSIARLTPINQARMDLQFPVNP